MLGVLLYDVILSCVLLCDVRMLCVLLCDIGNLCVLLRGVKFENQRLNI